MQYPRAVERMLKSYELLIILRKNGNLTSENVHSNIKTTRALVYSTYPLLPSAWGRPGGEPTIKRK